VVCQREREREREGDSPVLMNKYISIYYSLDMHFFQEQYIFIHKCLVFELECGNNADKELYPETDEGNIYLNIVMGKEESQTDEHIQVRILHEK